MYTRTPKDEDHTDDCKLISVCLHRPWQLHQVRGLSMVSPPPPEPVLMEEEACTDVLSLVQRCASATDGAVSQGGGFSLEAGAGPLVSPQVCFKYCGTT